MKKYLIILFLLLSSLVHSQEFDYNIYTGMTKKEITKSFKNDEFKYKIYAKLYVDIDSVGTWKLSDSVYTLLIYYNEDTKVLFTFDYKTNKCVKYYVIMNNLDNYWNYYDYYNRVYTKIGARDWKYDKNIISLRIISSNQITLFVEIKK